MIYRINALQFLSRSLMSRIIIPSESERGGEGRSKKIKFLRKSGPSFLMELSSATSCLTLSQVLRLSLLLPLQL